MKQNRQERIFAIIAELVVLFSALWDPIVSVVVSIVFLIGIAIREFMKK